MSRFVRLAAKPKADHERVLPLINVVFLLLVFFMLAGRIAASDPFRIVPPTSTSDGQTQVQNMVILVAADGRIAIDGQETAAADLAPAVAERLAASPGLRVHLKADAASEAVTIVALLEALRAAGVDRLQLLTVGGG